MDVFLLFAAPTILQFGNGQEFITNVINKHKQLCPETELVHGKNS